MDRIPREVEAAVLAVASTTKGYAGQLPDVYRRADRHRARRQAAVLLSVVLAVAGLGLAVRQRPEPAPPAAAPGPAQRLMIPGVAGMSSPTGVRVEHRAGAIGELATDGTFVTNPAGGTMDWKRAIGLPDGGLVALGDPGYLLTVDPRGTAARQDIRRAGEQVGLVAATGTTVYLWRPQGLAARGLTTGLERLVITSPTEERRNDDPADPPVAADVAGERLVVSRPSDSCRPMLLDIASLRGLRDLPLTSVGCMSVTGLRLSPSAGRLAVTYRSATGVRVAVLSTENGSVLADRPVPASSTATVEMAWQDDRNLRGVVVPSGPGVHDLTQFAIAG